MSHARALANAISGFETMPRSLSFEAVNLHDIPEVYDRKSKTLTLDKRDWQQPDVVCLALEGNRHNIFSLLQTKHKFSLGDAEQGSIPPADPKAVAQDMSDLQFVPRDMLKMAFRQGLGRVDILTGIIQSHFAGARFIHICSPPPVLAMRPLPAPEDRPADFNMSLYYLDFDACPPPLRLRIFEVQSEIYAEVAARHGAVFLAPPEQALTPDGFLDDAHWDSDPTHGNSLYGRLVLAQISAIVGTER